MNSLCRFLIFGIAFLTYTSNMQVNADVDEHNLEEYENFPCHANVPTPDIVKANCPELNIGGSINIHLARLVDDSFKDIHAQCNNDVAKLCNDLPNPVKKYSASGIQQCKEDVADRLCDKPLKIQEGRGKRVYCSYLKTVSKIVNLKQSRIVNMGASKKICTLFTRNKLLDAIAKNVRCQRIDAKLAKTHSHRAMLSSIAAPPLQW